MSTPPDADGPQEEKLASLLGELGEEPLEPGPGFEESVAGTVRWQRALNGVLGVVFTLGAAFADALSVILGRTPPAR